MASPISATLLLRPDLPVVAGSVLTISITSKTTASKTASDVLQDVQNELSRGGLLSVLSSKITTSLATGIIDMVAGLTASIPFQAELQVLSNTDFALTRDALSIVNHAFYNSVGSLPSTSSVTGVQAPGESAITATGQPGASAGGAGGAGTAGSIADAISNFFSGLKTTTISLVIGLAAILILVLLLIAYGPNVGKIAAAAH